MNDELFSPDLADLELLGSMSNVSRETIERFSIYINLLREWQSKTNLVSRHTLDNAWQRHICDSVQLWYLISKPESEDDDQEFTWLDFGSGAGFPGLVMAIMAADIEVGILPTRKMKVHLVESIAKKCAFLRRVIRETGVEAQVHNVRIESAAKLIPTANVVSARAVSALNNLFGLAEPWLSKGAVGLFPKGREYSGEIADCRGLWDFDLVEHGSKLSEDSVILEIHNLQRLSTSGQINIR